MLGRAPPPSAAAAPGGSTSIARAMRTVLFVGAGRHQRRAILRARELGLRVVAVDRNPDAPGLAEADAPEIVDFADVARVVAVARRHAVDGVLTVSADRAVPVVAHVADELDRKSTRLNSSHANISYAVFCLKKKKNTYYQ